MSADIGSAFTIFIETGLHAGTVQRFSPGIYTLGSELDADIVLSDSQIKAIHLVIELDRHGLRLEPLQGAADVVGESASLEPGSERYLSLPASFSVGGAVIKITAPKDAVQTYRRRKMAVVAAGLAFAAIVGFQVSGALTSPDIAGAPGIGEPVNATMQPPETDIAANTDNGPTDDPSLDKSMASDDADDVEAATLALPAVTLDEAAAALRDRLATDGFSDIDVKTAVDRIVVQGEAEPARMGEWQDIRIWYDGAFGQEILMVATVEPVEAPEPPKLAIEAVWMGEDPYLIAGGQRFFVGAHIGDGWTIDQIDAEEITFRRGDKSFSLTL